MASHAVVPAASERQAGLCAPPGGRLFPGAQQPRGRQLEEQPPLFFASRTPSRTPSPSSWSVPMQPGAQQLADASVPLLPPHCQPPCEEGWPLTWSSEVPVQEIRIMWAPGWMYQCDVRQAPESQQNGDHNARGQRRPAARKVHRAWTGGELSQTLGASTVAAPPPAAKPRPQVRTGHLAACKVTPPPPAPPVSVRPITSRGSVGHPVFCADACKYAWKPRGCKDGASCARCHVCDWSCRAARGKAGLAQSTK